jgi:hypothetical protein
MSNDGPGGPMIVRLIDVLFILLFGYLMIARFDVNAETDMPTRGGNSSTDTEETVGNLEITVNARGKGHLYEMTSSGMTARLSASIGARAWGVDPGSTGEINYLEFDQGAVLDEALAHRHSVLKDRKFTVHFVAQPEARTADLFRLVDICARHGLYAQSLDAPEGQVPQAPRVSFAFKAPGER